MSPELISWLLYIPFFAVALAAGVSFCIKGYKQGLWRALISLGTTVVCLVLSLFFARLLAMLLAGPAAGLVPDSVYDSVGPFRGLVYSVVQGLFQDVLSIVLFSVVLFVLLIVLKIVGNHIKSEELQPESAGHRWGGLGVRLVDALVVALFLLLPLYGTIATYVAPVADAAKIVMKEDNQAMTYLNSVSDNTLVTLYKAGPTAWVQRGLSGFTVGDADVDLADMADILEEAADLAERLINAEDEEEAEEALAELSAFLRENLVEEEWFFTMVCEFRQEAIDSLEQLAADGDELSEYDELMFDQIIPIFDVTQEEFEDNGIALLDFIVYCLESNSVDAMAEEDFAALSDDFFVRFGELLNHSDKAVAMKKFLFTGFTSELFYVSPDYEDYHTDYDRLESSQIIQSKNDYVVNIESTDVGMNRPMADSSSYDEDARDKAYSDANFKSWNDSVAFIENYWGNGYITDPAAQIKEAKAFVILMFGHGEGDVMEALARHPSFGADSVTPLLTDDFLKDNYYFDDDQLAELKNAPGVMSGLKDYLVQCQTAPLSSETSLDRKLRGLRDVLETIAIFRGEENYYYYSGNVDRESLSLLVDYFGRDYFVKEFEHGAKLYEIILACKENANENSTFAVQGISNLLLFLEKGENLPQGAIEDWRNDSDAALYLQYVSNIIGNSDLVSVLEAMVAQKGNDPLGVCRNLTSSQKQFLREAIDLCGDGEYRSYGSSFSTDIYYSDGQGLVSMSGGSLIQKEDGSYGIDKDGDGVADVFVQMATPGSGEGSMKVQIGAGNSLIQNFTDGNETAPVTEEQYLAGLKAGAVVLKAFLGL